MPRTFLPPVRIGLGSRMDAAELEILLDVLRSWNRTDGRHGRVMLQLAPHDEADVVLVTSGAICGAPRQPDLYRIVHPDDHDTELGDVPELSIWAAERWVLVWFRWWHEHWGASKRARVAARSVGELFGLPLLSEESVEGVMSYVLYSTQRDPAGARLCTADRTTAYANRVAARKEGRVIPLEHTVRGAVCLEVTQRPPDFDLDYEGSS